MTYAVGDRVLLACIDEESLEEQGVGYMSGMEDYEGQQAAIIEIEKLSTGYPAFHLMFEDETDFWVSEECLAPIAIIQNLNKFFDL